MLQANAISPWTLSEGDRFISQRGLNEDVTAKFGTKLEIFAQDLLNPESTSGNCESRQDGQNQGDSQQQQKQETSNCEEENRKMYKALLQNQVLGIDNPFLLNEIHNSEELMHSHNKDKLYSFQMQRHHLHQEHPEAISDAELMPPPEPKRVSQFPGSECAGGRGTGQESSPFNSKYNVLKFSNSKSPMSGSSGNRSHNKYGSSGGSGAKSANSASNVDATPQKRGLFANASNFTPVPFHQSRTMQFGLFPKAEAFSQSPCQVSPLQRISTPGALLLQPSPYSACENANPLFGLTNAVALTSIGSSLFPSSLAPQSSSLLTSQTHHPLTGLDEERVIVPSKRSRKISKIPYKVLDAPALQDDFYLNLVDWSSTNNLAVGLSNCIYIWSASNSKVTKLHELTGGMRDSVTSVCWSKRGQHLSIGTNSGVVQVWDINKQKLLRVLKGHEGRVGSIAWCNSVLSSGSKDKTILQRDLREKADSFGCLQSHRQEVCGLKWSFDEQQLASGGNDNKLCVWSVHNVNEPAGKFSSHQAAVKAITWSPHQHGLLASGGGTADRCIRFWNTTQMQEINAIETGSQVCNLVFSKNVNEIVSTHGYSDNAIMVWKYPSMKKVATLTGHSMRVLYLAMSPDGENIVTGAGDETLRFWKLFPPAPSSASDMGKISSLIDPQSLNIR